MNRIEQILAIQEAQELVEQAQDLVTEALKGTDYETTFKSYGKFGFDDLLGNGNSNNDSLQTLIDNL